MAYRGLCTIFLVLSTFVSLAPATASAQSELPTIEEKTSSLEKRDGLLPLYWDAAEGTLWMEIPRPADELIYVVSLPAGIGSNDIGLDRGQLGGERIVRFERVGRKLLMVQPNLSFRAISDNTAERRAVEDAFARSVLWGFEIAAATGERLLVDATEFALRDVHGVATRLRSARQGNFSLDKSRSALHLDRTRAFPRNTEIEVTLTFTADSAGSLLRGVAPTPEIVTVRERHSFVALPPPGYTPRRADPRAGYFGIQFTDFAAPIDEPVTQRYIARHRLEKADPSAAVSEPIEPIVYYLDPGAPEPVRSALLDGARWWADAFEAAGFRNAYRVEMLPDTADPMDVRYNVIQWVHRSTRGWSYGSSVTDPRTGEIIKGHVSLGSLRVRQDYLLAEGLLSPYTTGDERPPELEEMALARIRQLSAHEIGHTLGIAHNFLASTYDRGSVMDYPHPLVRLRDDGTIDLSDAYDAGMGEWDRVAVEYGYRVFPEGVDEEAALDQILDDAIARGLGFISDQDARPVGGAHPAAHLWDNGPDPVAELDRVMDVRRAALDRFGETAIRRGMPYATLEEVLVPLYLHHRYQAEAAVKVIGGVHYTYALRGDGQQPLQRVPAHEQMAALDALLRTVQPQELALPRELLELIPPRPYGYGLHRELFDRNTGPTFDAIAPATAAAEFVVSLILHPQRAARLIEQHALDPSLPGLDAVIGRLIEAGFATTPGDSYHAAIQRETGRAVAEELMRLAYGADVPQVQATATLALSELRDRLDRSRDAGDRQDRAFHTLIVNEIDRFLDRPFEPARRPSPIDLPPGSPIGAESAIM